MPRRNGTGPIGRGALTGRRLGGCDYERGTGLGLGYGRGIRRGLCYNLDDKEMLEQEKKILESRLDYIKNHLEKL